MKNVSVVLCVKHRLEQKVSFRENKKSTAPVVTKKNLLHDALNVIR